MTMLEAPPAARRSGAATGEIKLEIGWHPDRLRITALGAGPGAITKAYLSDTGEDVIVEIKLPGPDERYDFVPGAD